MTHALRLTPPQTKLLRVLQANGDWMSRKDIARAFRRAHLRTHEVAGLNRMVATGFVVIRRVPTTKGAVRYEYRAIRMAASPSQAWDGVNDN